MSRRFNLEDCDLGTLTHALRLRFGTTLEGGYLDGRTVLRDAVTAHLGCSVLEAETLVDTLEAMGYVRFPELADATHSRQITHWVIDAIASS